MIDALFKSTAAVLTSSSLFRDVTQRQFVVTYRYLSTFGTAGRSGNFGNTPEDRRSHEWRSYLLNIYSVHSLISNLLSGPVEGAGQPGSCYTGTLKPHWSNRNTVLVNSGFHGKGMTTKITRNFRHVFKKYFTALC
jgi:hypothetical protein